MLSEPGYDDETYEPQIFSLKGRIGRLRYMGYTWLLMIICGFAIGFIAAVAVPALAGSGKPGAGFAIFMIVLYGPVIAVSLIMAMRRLHDLNNSGWLSLLSLVPFVNIFFGLYLLFAPGTNGRNSYGPMPSKNPSWLWAAIFLPFIAFGILAAIAIPQYQKYVQRAKAAQVQQLEQQAPSDQPQQEQR